MNTAQAFDGFIDHSNNQNCLDRFDQLQYTREAVALYDASSIRRLSLRGPQAALFLEQGGLFLPPAINKAKAGEQGELVMRTGNTEFWVLNPAIAPQTILQEVSNTPACYPLFLQHSHAWLVLSGEAKAEMMAKVCGVDLRQVAFVEGDIVQTSVARINCVIVHHTIAGQPVFSILCDGASSRYLWGALKDAMAEFV